jgi:uncharacterized protein YndB with AHSA1/START domain
VITVAMSTVIGAERSRVWRALVHPDQLARWDARIVALAGPSDPPPLRPGATLRFRCRVGATGGVQMLRREQALEVVPEQRLRTRLALGTLRIERTWTLASIPPAAGQPEQTRLSLALRAANSVAVFGATIDRFRVRELAAELGDEALRALQKWCEADAESA